MDIILELHGRLKKVMVSCRVMIWSRKSIVHALSDRNILTEALFVSHFYMGLGYALEVKVVTKQGYFHI